MIKQAVQLPSDPQAPYQKTPLWQYVRTSSLPVILTVPVIYACLVPFLALDLALTIYQSICFPVYGIPKVRRGDYMIFDRGRLAYLNAIEKVHCVYCSYGNGVLAYVAEIAGRTEQHFCPIKHAQDLRQEHSRYRFFLPHGDAHAYRTQGERVTQDWDDLRNRNSTDGGADPRVRAGRPRPAG